MNVAWTQSFLWALASRLIVSRTIETWLLSSKTLLLAALVVMTAVIRASNCFALRNLKKIDAIEIDALSRADWNVSAKRICSFFEAPKVCLTLAKP